jgi:glycosyltransferase involved in cell wall biosynthesis
MKVIFCLHHFLPEFVGGTEIYTFNLARHLIQQNTEVVVLVPNLGVDSTKEYDYEGVRVIKYAENSVEDRVMILGKKKPDGLELFGELLIKEKPTLVHFHELAPGRGINIFHVEKAYQLKFPVAITFHVPFYAGQYSPLLYKKGGNSDGKIDVAEFTKGFYIQKGMSAFKATVVSKLAMSLFKLNIDTTGLNCSFGTALGFPFVVDRLKKDLLRLSIFAEKFVVVANWYKEVLKKNNVPCDKIIFIKQGLANHEIKKPVKSSFTVPLRVVYIGRITALKGLHVLIDAVLSIPFQKIHLDIYGSQDSAPYILNCKEKTKGHENIHWQGRIDSSEVIPMLSSYDLLCLPSAFEMSPLVIQEAFTAGIPVLASNVYGNAEQITDGLNGWLFNCNDANDLEKKLQILINKPFMLAEATKHFPVLNTFTNVANDHLKLYGSIIQNYQAH